MQRTTLMGSIKDASMKKRGGKQQSGTQCGPSTLLEIRELSMHTTASEPFRAGSLRKTMDMEGARIYIGPQLISSQKTQIRRETKKNSSMAELAFN